MDKEIREMLEASPLMAVSPISEMQSKYLIKLGEKLILEMELWTDYVGSFNEVYRQYWLWVLGTYEVTRTLLDHHNKRKFKRKCQRKIYAYKEYITNIRVPFAKQKLATPKGAPEIMVFSELMVKELNKDMEFEIKGIKYSAKESIEKFNKLISGIKLSEINYS